MSIPNVEKLFQYLQCFSKHPIEYNETKIGDQITQIKLNSTLFYSDNCLNCYYLDSEQYCKESEIGYRINLF